MQGQTDHYPVLAGYGAEATGNLSSILLLARR